MNRITLEVPECALCVQQASAPSVEGAKRALHVCSGFPRLNTGCGGGWGLLLHNWFVHRAPWRVGPGQSNNVRNERAAILAARPEQDGDAR